MESLEIAGSLAIVACTAWAGAFTLNAIRSSRAVRKLTRHPLVQPLEQALPVNAPLFKRLIADLAACAGVPEPKTWIYRSALPDAFVAATCLHPDLFLADELLERANRAGKHALDILEQAIAHELAHIKLHQELAHALLVHTPPPFKAWADARLQRMEREADAEAGLILQRYHAAPRTSRKDIL